jgi:antirestriction protein ArdC
MNKLYQQVTDTILAAFEDCGPWERPWISSDTTAPFTIPRNQDGRPYSGMNVLALWVALNNRGYTHSTWGTYKNWAAKGAQVQKGEKGVKVVYFARFEAKESDGSVKVDRDGDPVMIGALKAYTVFNIAQTDAEQPAPIVADPVDATGAAPIPVIDQFLDATGARIRHGGDRAYYSPALDYIQIPPREFFTETKGETGEAGYYGTALHELTHWTGHETRMDRFKPNETKQDFAFEELVAELGAAMLSAEFGIMPTVPRNHAAYLKGWQKHLADDPKAIFRAAAQAQKAADHLRGKIIAEEPERIAA